jgi:hypothetical protein
LVSFGGFDFQGAAKASSGASELSISHTAEFNMIRFRVSNSPATDFSLPASGKPK